MAGITNVPVSWPYGILGMIALATLSAEIVAYLLKETDDSKNPR